MPVYGSKDFCNYSRNNDTTVRNAEKRIDEHKETVKNLEILVKEASEMSKKQIKNCKAKLYIDDKIPTTVFELKQNVVVGGRKSRKSKKSRKSRKSRKSNKGRK